MILCQAINIIKEKEMNSWMAWGVLKWNDGYCICGPAYIKRFPNLPYVYMRKGESFKINLDN